MKKPGKNKFVCSGCFKLKKCREPLVSWVLFFMGLFATVSLRAVNVVLNVNPLWAKIFWYAGVGGFFVFFVYKFRYYTLMQEEIKRQGLTDKLLFKEELSSRDYELLGTIICKLSSGKDKINFFFIFLFSAVAIIVAVYMDLLKGR